MCHWRAARPSREAMAMSIPGFEVRRRSFLAGLPPFRHAFAGIVGDRYTGTPHSYPRQFCAVSLAEAGCRRHSHRLLERNVRMRHLAISLILILSTMLAFADDPPAEVPPGEIAGIVTNQDGQPIEGALVHAMTYYPHKTTTDNAV